MNNPNSPKKSPEAKASTSAAALPRSYHALIFMAIVYAAWLIWLLYVGLVNYQAGNQ